MRDLYNHFIKAPLLVVISMYSMLGAAPALAEIYKCQSQGNIVYSDIPCSAASTQSLPDIDEPTSQASNASNDALNKKLDQAVKSAINNGDLIRAKALASTSEQRAWVSEAEKSQFKQNTASNKAAIDSEACQNAMNELDAVKSLPSTAETLNSKTRQMNTACGFKTPATVYNTPVRLPYGGYYPYPHNPHHPYPQQPHKPDATPPPSSNPADYPRPKQENFGSRFIRPEDGILKYE